MNTIRPIQEILDVEMLQKVQNQFSDATGMGFVTVDYKGMPITEPSGFTDFCKIVRRKTNLCNICDAHGGLRAEIDGKPVIYRCHTGLLDFAVPLTLNGVYCGAILGGQVCCEEKKPAEVEEKVIDQKTDWEAFTDMRQARRFIKTLPIAKIKAFLQLLQTTIEYLLDESYSSLMIDELVAKDKALIGEKQKRMDIEMNMDKLIAENSRFILDNRAIMDYISVISDMAYMEKAAETQNALYVLSHLMRYSYSGQQESVSDIQHEMGYIETYLEMEKIRIGSKLHYIVEPYEEYADVSCPANIIKPIIDNAVRYTVEPYDDGGRIIVSFVSDEQNLYITVADTGSGLPEDVIENIMNDSDVVLSSKNRYELHRINRTLKFFYGTKYQLRIENDRSGGRVTICIPLNGETGKDEGEVR
ncbi:MAG: PocR ligand-binding domain-containing protein [Eubacteriaceae bacterium]|jgi:ligand-binding sensor protein|nr:PocR ligand-binding domain-containing protein [Eubacteriaceae bacterium]